MHRYAIEIDGHRFTVDVQDTSADRFDVTVDGRAFTVALSSSEDLGGSTDMPRIAPAGPPAAPAPATVNAGAAALRAPMPGTILRIAVGAGTQVERGQDLLVLEAMKMENVIRAPRAGRVAVLCVQAGQQVAHGELLLRFDDDTGAP
jgi:biotin carboxyl carrier protein